MAVPKFLDVPMFLRDVYKSAGYSVTGCIVTRASHGRCKICFLFKFQESWVLWGCDCANWTPTARSANVVWVPRTLVSTLATSVSPSSMVNSSRPAELGSLQGLYFPCFHMGMSYTWYLSIVLSAAFFGRKRRLPLEVRNFCCTVSFHRGMFTIFFVFLLRCYSNFGNYHQQSKDSHVRRSSSDLHYGYKVYMIFTPAGSFLFVSLYSSAHNTVRNFTLGPVSFLRDCSISCGECIFCIRVSLSLLTLKTYFSLSWEICLKMKLTDLSMSTRPGTSAYS